MQTIHYNIKPDKVVTWSELAIKQQSNILPILLPLAISYSFFYLLLFQAWLCNKYFFSKTFVIKGRLENWETFEGGWGDSEGLASKYADGGGEVAFFGKRNWYHDRHYVKFDTNNVFFSFFFVNLTEASRSKNWSLTRYKTQGLGYNVHVYKVWTTEENIRVSVSVAGKCFKPTVKFN